MPATMPVLPIVAIAGALLLHTPPPEASFNRVEPNGQTVSVPVMVPAIGAGLTVTMAVATAVPQLLVTA